MSKEIAGFFDSVDQAKTDHSKKKSSVFASANEEAMDTWLKKQQAVEMEKELRELIVQTRGYSAYQELLKLRRDILRERKEANRLAKIEKQEQQEVLVITFICVGSILLILGGLSLYFEILDPKMLW